MRLSLTTPSGDLRVIEVDSSIELENLKALIEVEFNLPPANQSIYHNGLLLSDNSKTVSQLGILQDDILLVRPINPTAAQIPSSAAASTGISPQIEAQRQQIINSPNILRQLSTSHPALATAALNNPAEFQRLLLEIERQRREFEQRQQAQMNALAFADPFDVEAQKRIEDEIRKENIQQNMETAMEHNPEVFGRVIMLYINCEVNGHPVKAFVDSGAQATIMSPECARSCGVMHLVDERFAGVAVGVGTAKILGRVHSAQLKIGKLFLPCSFTVMEGKGVDLLFGLDMLKRYQACIDLKSHTLRIDDEEIPFLAEHELPEKARMELAPESPLSPKPVEGGSSSRTANTSIQPTSLPPQAVAPPSSNSANTAASTTSAPQSGSRWPEASIKALLDIGASRIEAISALDACNGNVDLAANIIFQG
ncbi:DNA damage-inducible protein 1 [Nowakowskiella sp. JEL0407]|nr:DNA damage-inducible protein 1 [Nowakowskiella sp. JEL0407]